MANTKDTGDKSTDDALAHAEAMLREQDDLRKQLLAQRGTLSERIDRIDAVLKQLGTASPKATRAASVPKSIKPSRPRRPRRREVYIRAARSTLTDAVVELLRKHHQGLASPEIFAALQKTRKGLDGPSLHSTLYRLVDTGRIEARGERGSRLYAAVGKEVKG